LLQKLAQIYETELELMGELAVAVFRDKLALDFWLFE
jgi:hypothetical protein